MLIVMMIDHSLADRNECEGQHNCGQICGNTPGSYYCTCRPGYYLSSDLRTCKGNMPVSIHAEKKIHLTVSILIDLQYFFCSVKRSIYFSERLYSLRTIDKLKTYILGKIVKN